MKNQVSRHLDAVTVLQCHLDVSRSQVEVDAKAEKENEKLTVGISSDE